MTIASTYSQKVAVEIRAEMARQHKKANHLAKLLGCEWHTARSRLDGRSPFTYDELMAICAWLDVTLEDLDPNNPAVQGAPRAS